ncbi:MAG: pyroglutamyl-peptidase I [Hyphomicrobiaceae bacterium]|nr:pyroglutamyl-peptidase I [Hyphomicrobiaceae bacterium]
MSKLRPVILLTGFGPFPGVQENASAALVPELASQARKLFPGHHVEAAVLPTEWRAGPAAAAALIGELMPVAALHFGVSGKARGFVVESRGHNHARPICDAAGRLPSSDRLSPEGPDILAASVPAARIVERLRRRALPASLSRDAGGYLCNAVLYGSLERARQASRPMRCGFVHLPATLGLASAPFRAGVRLDWPQAIEGGLEIVAAALGRPPRAC